MRINAYAILDVKAAVYYTPFYMLNDAMAQRQFRDLAQDPKHMFGRYPEDFMLYRVGVYDDENGELAGTKKVALGHPIIPIENVVPLEVRNA